jgi:AraC-like DNA-binding protein
VSPLNVLWVNAGATGLREAWTPDLARLGDVRSVEASRLLSLDGDGGWDFVCFNFDYPDMAGLKLISGCKKRWPSIPVVMLTMRNSADLSLWALRSRVFDVLVKPLTEEEIGRCLERLESALLARRSQSSRQAHTSSPPMPTEVRYRPRPVGTSRLELAKAQVSKHFARHIPESEVALLCEMSPSRFCREFKAAYGVTFVEYLADYRIAQAKRLLENPEMPVADVAAAVGFADPSYFTRVFRKQEGVSPTEYRARGITAPVDVAQTGS